MRSMLFASAAIVLTTSFAFAQAPVPDAPVEAAPPARVAPPVRKPVAARPVTPASRQAEAMEITQIVGIRQVDSTTYEIDAKNQSGAAVNLRMNVFVMQDLGRQLGTYGK